MIFVDSSFWIALGSARDACHDEATALLREVGSEPLLTTNAIRGETWTFTRRRYGHPMAVALVDRLERTPRLSIEFVSPSHESEAWRWLRRHDERKYSFVDATSFTLMRELGLHEAYAFDGDFAAAGFVELRA